MWVISLHVLVSFVTNFAFFIFGSFPIVKVTARDHNSARKTMPVANVLVLPRISNTSVECRPFIESPPHIAWPRRESEFEVGVSSGASCAKHKKITLFELAAR